MRANVLIIEDEPAIAELVAVHLKHAGMHPISAPDAAAATSLIAEVLPDAIVLDWMLPGMSGMQFMRELKAGDRTRVVPVVMLTARAAEQHKVDGLEAGADDYVTKPFLPKELVARIRALLRRHAPQLTDDVVTVGGLTLNPTTCRVFVKEKGVDAPVQLGPTEFRLLHFLMTHPERVHSRAQILDRVWGDHVFIEERTIDVHVKRLRAALKLVEYDGIIETVRGCGYRLTALSVPRRLEDAA
ncbi:chemotaxis protein CheY [Caballeronia jiangsuensis]|nr:chemotaxis protein CheY [Caballeronia jiangsuensis]